jgi:hypothetical protein
MPPEGRRKSVLSADRSNIVNDIDTIFLTTLLASQDIFDLEEETAGFKN